MRTSAQQSGDLALHVPEDFFGRPGRIQDADPEGFPPRDFEVGIPHPPVEILLLGFEPIAPAAVALPGASETHLRGAVEKESPVRAEISDAPPVDSGKQGGIDSAASSLVRECRVAEAVAENERSPGEGGSESLGDVLAAVGFQEHQLRDRIEVTVRRIEKDFPDRGADPRSSGLSL